MASLTMTQGITLLSRLYLNEDASTRRAHPGNAGIIVRQQIVQAGLCGNAEIVRQRRNRAATQVL